MNLNIIDRLELIMKEKGINDNQLTVNAGLSVGLIGKARKTRNGLHSDSIEKILYAYSDINPSWLLMGTGEMFTTSTQKDGTPIAVAQETPQGGIPLVSMEVAAGFGSSDFAIREEDIQAHYIVPDFNGIDFMIRVKGSSMYPKYSSGDIVACRKLHDSKFIQWNKCYVIATKEQGLLVKRLKQSTTPEALLAVSDNKEYDPFEIPKDEITGIALVVGVIRLE